MRLVNRIYEELQPGESAELKRLVTPDDLYVFAAASGNYNPMHLPDADGDGDGRPEQVAPGMYTASLIAAVLGNLLPGPGMLYRRQSLDFRDRAHAGDELVCTVTVDEKLPDGVVRLKTQVRRAGEDAPVVTGTAEVIAPSRRFDRSDLEMPGLVVQRHRHFDALLERARPLPPLATAVVTPNDPNSLGGALLAARESLIVPIILGRADDIRAAAAWLDEVIADHGLIDVVGGDKLAAQMACRLVQEGRAAAVMKGHKETF